MGADAARYRRRRVGAVVWSPLGWGRLTGKIRRGQPLPEGSRLHQTAQWGPPVDDERLYRVVEALDAVADGDRKERCLQIAIAWLLARLTVSSVIIGARNETQFRDNLGVAEVRLTPEQVASLDAASEVMPAYPYYPYRTQAGFARLNPPSVWM